MSDINDRFIVMNVNAPAIKAYAEDAAQLRTADLNELYPAADYRVFRLDEQ